MPSQISKHALKLTEKARAAAEEEVILVSQKRKGSNSSIANADTKGIATHTVTKVTAKRVKANPPNLCCTGSNPVLNVWVQQKVVVINLGIGGCKGSSHGQKPPGGEEESSDVKEVEPDVKKVKPYVEEVELEKEETAENELNMLIELQNSCMH